MVNLDPTKSLCYTCKYGLCMLQQSEVRISGNITLEGHEEESFGGLELPQEHEHFHNETKICGLCYWCPKETKMDSPIILTASVQKCSRYEKRAR